MARKKCLPIAEAIQRYLQGESASSIARSFGLSYATIQRRLGEHGVPLRGKQKTLLHRSKISQARTFHIDEQHLRSLASQGLTAREIALFLDGHPSEECVRRRMVQLGIDRLAPKARADRNHFWAGGYAVDADGYILKKSPHHPHRTAAGYVRQHRLVMEQGLGRLLDPREVVDHRNGDRSDNRLENLRLFASNADHLRETLTGKKKLPAQEREKTRREAVQRAKRIVATILANQENDAGR